MVGNLIKKFIKNENISSFDFDVKEMLSHEYSHQIIFYRPSENWLDYQGKGIEYSLPYLNTIKPKCTLYEWRNSDFFKFKIPDFKF